MTSRAHRTVCAFSSIGCGHAAEFRRRYRAEIADQANELDALRAMVKGRIATLITATREVDLSHAAVMREILQRKKK